RRPEAIHEGPVPGLGGPLPGARGASLVAGDDWHSPTTSGLECADRRFQCFIACEYGRVGPRPQAGVDRGGEVFGNVEEAGEAPAMAGRLGDDPAGFGIGSALDRRRDRLEAGAGGGDTETSLVQIGLHGLPVLLQTTPFLGRLLVAALRRRGVSVEPADLLVQPLGFRDLVGDLRFDDFETPVELVEFATVALGGVLERPHLAPNDG